MYVISDSEHYKSQALRNAQEAYQIHQEKVSSYERTSTDTLAHSLYPVHTVLIPKPLPVDADVWWGG